MEKHADLDFLFKKRMQYFFLFSVLVRDEHLLSGFIGHDYGARIGLGEAVFTDLLQVDEGKHEPVGQKRPKLLHEVQGQSRPARPVSVEKPYGRVEARRLQGGTDVVHGQGIHERKKSVDIVQGWPPVPLLKYENPPSER